MTDSTQPSDPTEAKPLAGSPTSMEAWPYDADSMPTPPASPSRSSMLERCRAQLGPDANMEDAEMLLDMGLL